MDLRAYRKSKGWTLMELAQFLGVANESVVRRYETGERMPRPHIIEKIDKLTAGAVGYGDHLAARKAWQCKQRSAESAAALSRATG